jgi:hypothetical protein
MLKAVSILEVVSMLGTVLTTFINSYLVSPALPLPSPAKFTASNFPNTIA